MTVSLPENVTSVSDLVLLNSKGTTLTNSKLQKYSGHKQGVYYCNVIIPPEVRHYKYFKIVVYMYIKTHGIPAKIHERNIKINIYVFNIWEMLNYLYVLAAVSSLIFMYFISFLNYNTHYDYFREINLKVWKIKCINILMILDIKWSCVIIHLRNKICQKEQYYN